MVIFTPAVWDSPRICEGVCPLPHGSTSIVGRPGGISDVVSEGFYTVCVLADYPQVTAAFLITCKWSWHLYSGNPV